jgi:homoserine kinase type II
VIGKVYLLSFVQERNSDEEDTELLIGVYESEEKAKDAIERLKDRPGFVDFPQGFVIDAYELNQDHWLEGFVRL